MRNVARLSPYCDTDGRAMFRGIVDWSNPIDPVGDGVTLFYPYIDSNGRIMVRGAAPDGNIVTGRAYIKSGRLYARTSSSCENDPERDADQVDDCECGGYRGPCWVTINTQIAGTIDCYNWWIPGNPMQSHYTFNFCECLSSILMTTSACGGGYSISPCWAISHVGYSGCTTHRDPDITGPCSGEVDLIGDFWNDANRASFCGVCSMFFYLQPISIIAGQELAWRLRIIFQLWGQSSIYCGIYEAHPGGTVPEAGGFLDPRGLNYVYVGGSCDWANWRRGGPASWAEGWNFFETISPVVG